MSLYTDHIDASRREIILKALRKFDGNRTHAAEWLGISRAGLQRAQRRLGVEFDPGGLEPVEEQHTGEQGDPGAPS